MGEPPTLIDIYERLARIETNTNNLFVVVDSFQKLYQTLDVRVRCLEIEGHTCKNEQLMRELETFMSEYRGAQKARAPIWEIVKSGVSQIIGILIALCIGFAAGKG